MNLEDLEILEYTEDMGTVNWPAGFEQDLEGNNLDEQLAYYRVLRMRYIPLSYYLADWKDLEKYRLLETLDSYGGWEKVIVRSGKIVGFVRCGKTILPYGLVWSDIRSDNNGAGYKERTDYYYLVCVPQPLDRERCFTPPFGAPVPELKVPVIPYDGSRGEDLLPEGFAARLAGKPLAVQMYYFGIVDEKRGLKKDWVDDWERYGEYHVSDLCLGRRGMLHFRTDVAGLIVHNDVIVGVRVRLEENAIGGNTADLYPYEKYCYKIELEGSIYGLDEPRELTCECFPG